MGYSFINVGGNINTTHSDNTAPRQDNTNNVDETMSAGANNGLQNPNNTSTTTVRNVGAVLRMLGDSLNNAAIARRDAPVNRINHADHG